MDIVLKQDTKAFDKMMDYNVQDVLLLEDVYNEIKAWDKKHPSTVVLQDLTKPACNVCGSTHVIKNGSYSTNTNVYQKYQCSSCGHNMRSRKAEKKSNPNLLRSY